MSGRGRELGFPTANVHVDTSVPDGIFVSRTQVDGVWLPSVTFIGIPTTFRTDAIRRGETYLLDGTHELRSQVIRVELLEYIRKNQTFPTVSSLVHQIEEDVKVAKQYFLTHSL